jgi:SPP1 gp7 family putative phage head morphogenesis protein
MAVTAATVRDLTDTLLRHQVLLQRLSTSEQKKFVPFLKEMDKELRARLSAGELTTYSRERLQRMLKSVDEMLAELLGDFQSQLLLDLDEIAKTEAPFSAKALGIVIDADAVVPAVSLIRSAVLNNPLSIKDAPLLKPFIKDWTTAERKAVAGVIRRGVFQGQTNAQIVQAIRGTKARQYQDGLLDVTARHAATLVHTAIQHTSSQARQATFEENGDIVEGVQWISTLDNKTCPVCRSLDRQTFALSKGPRAPIHPNCRCTLIPWLGKRFEQLMRGATRASAGAAGGAQVDANLDYYKWLKTQPKSFVEIALGPKRAKLFLDGGLSAERFAALQLDRNFEPLTLVEMRALEPLAFERAGLN